MATTGGNLLATNALHVFPRPPPCRATNVSRDWVALPLRGIIAVWQFLERANIASRLSYRHERRAGALEATIHIRRRKKKGERSVSDRRFFICFQETRRIVKRFLEPGDLITHVTLPAARAAEIALFIEIARPRFVRIRTRISRSCCHHCGGKITRARVALGALARNRGDHPKPKRNYESVRDRRRVSQSGGCGIAQRQTAKSKRFKVGTANALSCARVENCNPKLPNERSTSIHAGKHTAIRDW